MFDLLKGDEIYNTYGEHSNQDLLHMYGFVETHPNNIYDNVEIPTSILLTTIKNMHNDTEPLQDEKIKLFQELDLIDENVSIVIDSNGVLNEEEVLQLLQVQNVLSKFFKKKITIKFHLTRSTACHVMNFQSFAKTTMSLKTTMITIRCS